MSNTPQLVYSRRFDRDFSEILRYLRQSVSDRAADIIRDRVFEVIDSLPENPERYPPEPRLAHLGNYRVIRMRKAPYKIFYRYTGTQIRMERIFHSKRDFDRIFRRFKF